MAPWLRVDRQLVDIGEAIAFDLVEGFQDDSWNKPPRIHITYKNGTERQVTFDNFEGALKIYEMLFQLVMPDAAQQHQENQDGSGVDTELRGEGMPTDT